MLPPLLSVNSFTARTTPQRTQITGKFVIANALMHWCCLMLFR